MQTFLNNIDIIVDCQFSEWSLGSCNATCGLSAFRAKTREVLSRASDGGKECDGDITINENCNLKPCPGKRFF